MQSVFMPPFLPVQNRHQPVVAQDWSTSCCSQYISTSVESIATNLGDIWQFWLVNWTVLTDQVGNCVNWNYHQQSELMKKYVAAARGSSTICELILITSLETTSFHQTLQSMQISSCFFNLCITKKATDSSNHKESASFHCIMMIIFVSQKKIVNLHRIKINIFYNTKEN